MSVVPLNEGGHEKGNPLSRRPSDLLLLSPISAPAATKEGGLVKQKSLSPRNKSADKSGGELGAALDLADEISLSRKQAELLLDGKRVPLAHFMFLIYLRDQVSKCLTIRVSHR
jgi:hypothetical protein